MVGSIESNKSLIDQWSNIFTSKDSCSHKQQHWSKFTSLGLPTRDLEDWKYTPIDSLFNHQFDSRKANRITAGEVDELSLRLDAIYLVFLDGCFQPSLSTYDTGSFRIESMNNLGAHHNLSPIRPESFLHLTESLAENSIIISLPKGKVASRPLYLLHITSGRKDVMNMIHYRNHLEIEDNSQAEIIEHYITLNNMSHFTGARLTFSVGNNSNLTHTKLSFENNSSYHFSHNDIRLGHDSCVKSNSFLLGAGFSRHNTSVRFAGESSRLSLNSLALPMINQILDSRTYVEHNKAHCFSNQIHKTIAWDKGRSVLNNHIKVVENALGTDGKLINNNLLLGDMAEVYTKPQLEIYADDVKCGHGATVGCIDRDQMFYLCSRGIQEKDAHSMIVNAFSAEVIQTLENRDMQGIVLDRVSSLTNGII